jgi:hypothetical protein
MSIVAFRLHSPTIDGNSWVEGMLPGGASRMDGVYKFGCAGRRSPRIIGATVVVLG